jgi:hypothetical protein
MINPANRTGMNPAMGEFANLVVRERHNMEIASPFVVVPVIVVVFFACILWATGGRTNSEQPTESSAGHMPE